MPSPRITPALVPGTSAPDSRAIHRVGSEPRGLPGHSGSTPPRAAPASENGHYDKCGATLECLSPETSQAALGRNPPSPRGSDNARYGTCAPPQAPEGGRAPRVSAFIQRGVPPSEQQAKLRYSLGWCASTRPGLLPMVTQMVVRAVVSARQRASLRSNTWTFKPGCVLTESPRTSPVISKQRGTGCGI